MLKNITRNSYLNLLSGVVLLFTSGYEIWDSFGQAFIGAHHGIFIFSLIHIGKSIPEIMHGLQHIEEADEVIEAKIQAGHTLSEEKVA